MGIWTSIKNFFRAQKDDAAKALANPIRDGKYAIKDSEEQILKFKSALADHIASNKGLTRQLLEAKKNVEKYTKLMDLAVAADKNDDVRTISASLLSAKEIALGLKKEIDKNNNLIDSFKAQIDAAERKVDRAEQQFTQLSLRSKSVELRESLIASADGLTGIESPLAMLDEFSKQVEEKEDVLDAREELSSTPMERLEADYSSFDSTSVDAEYSSTFSSEE